MRPAWRASFCSSYFAKAASGPAHRPKECNLPLLFFAHWPLACENRGKSGYGLAGLSGAAGVVELLSDLATLLNQGLLCSRPERCNAPATLIVEPERVKSLV